MIRDIDGSAHYPINQECSLVYEYLHQCAASQSPAETISLFQNLFKFASKEDVRVTKALEKLIFANKNKQQFDIFLSQCFYTILDCWLETPESIDCVSELLAALETIGSTKSYDRRRKQLAQLTANYYLSESYLQLRTVIEIINPHQVEQISVSNSLSSEQASSNSTTFNNCLVRYTYLYRYFLPPHIEAHNLIALLEKLQANRQKDFEIMLSKHIIYRFRLKQLAKMKLMSKGAGRIINQVNNPSLLSENAFRIAMRQYIGKNDNNSSLLERSQLFVVENEHRLSYKKFKQDLYCFLVSDLNPRNSTYRFNNRLKQKLENIFAHSDDKSLNKTLILQTCRQLFSFLIVDPASDSDPMAFSQLVANLGTAQAIMLLIKITLICPESKADLEKKILAVVIHHQLKTVQEAPWLLKSLEHLLIAFSIYFGKIDVSLAKSAVRH